MLLSFENLMWQLYQIFIIRQTPQVVTVLHVLVKLILSDTQAIGSLQRENAKTLSARSSKILLIENCS